MTATATGTGCLVVKEYAVFGILIIAVYTMISILSIGNLLGGFAMIRTKDKRNCRVKGLQPERLQRETGLTMGMMRPILVQRYCVGANSTLWTLYARFWRPHRAISLSTSPTTIRPTMRASSARFGGAFLHRG